MATLKQLAAALAGGETTSVQLVEECLAAISDPAGEGARTFLAVDADGARAAAEAMDLLRSAGAEPSPWAGIPVSVKDLFDVRGQVTRAGSRALAGPPAVRDASAVARWRAAGLVLIGRTNMTEFAYSGLGVNPHYGTPAAPGDRSEPRIPGGSSSGAAVSITDAMAYGALGSDTGGSCRIPAALTGCCGFRPTQRRMPRDGVVPLSDSLDTPGVLANSVGCLAILDALLSGEPPAEPAPLARPPRLALVRNYLFEDVDASVGAAFERLCTRLSGAGAELCELEIPALAEVPELTPLASAEAYACHHELLAQHADQYDPRVRARLEVGARLSARELLDCYARRKRFIATVGVALAGFDALLCPTTPTVAPTLAALADDGAYQRANLLMLRNPYVLSMLDGCGASVPMHAPGELPSGAMVGGPAGSDARVLAVAAWIERQGR